jgi:glycine cleavage system regulatory protein
MNIYGKIIERLQQSADRPSLYKIFTFSIEDFQDKNDRLMEIADYLKLHEGKIEDFSIHTWVDSETFKPVLMIQVIPNEEYRQHIKSLSQDFSEYFKNQTNKKQITK